MLVNNIFMDIGLIIIIATFFAFLAKLLKQPLVPAYVLTGLLLGPILQIITNRSIIETLSEMGIAFLLFIVGLEIDMKKLKNVGLVSSLGGAARTLIFFSIGFILMLIAGFTKLEAVYIGIIISFSSTMVVIKILSDKHELDTLHGRIIVGFLLMEDIIAIFAISILASLEHFTLALLLLSLWKGLVIIVIARSANKYIFPWLFKFAAKSQELLFLAAMGVCFVFSLLAHYGLGFSISIGAFVAGVALANLPYNYEIIGRVRSMRDFFSTIFFVSLGMSIVKLSIDHLFITILLIAIVWFVKPFVTLFITSFFGYKRRTSFLTSISLAQTSEFSLIIVTQGLIMGHISQELFSIIAIIAVLTMASTSYFIKYEYMIYSKMSNFLKRFDRFSTNGKNGLELSNKNQKYDVLLVGYDRIGYSIVKKLHILKKKLLVVDFNPEVIKKLIKENIHCIYGDIGDIEILERIRLNQIAMVISTSPDKRDNSLLIKKTKETNKKAIVFVTAYKVEDALELYDAGADYVILPHFLGGDHVSILIEQFGNDMDKMIRNKFGHIEELKNRQTLGHDKVQHNINDEG
ncbi:MAG: cation:proton antiporter [Nanoarchaeota archaeon]|nr:cation:proton antiporter [Nanoarchaeota archaeon]